MARFDFKKCGTPALQRNNKEKYHHRFLIN